MTLSLRWTACIAGALTLVLAAVACGNDASSGRGEGVVLPVAAAGGQPGASSAAGPVARDASLPDGANSADASTDDDAAIADASTPGFTLGGAVTGLVGAGLVLQDNHRDDLPISASGSFTFDTRLATGAPFDVAVRTQPSSPAQTCTVENASGTIAMGNVTTVRVACATNAYAVGGSIRGLAGSGLTLQDNLVDNLSVVATSPSFLFPTKVSSGGAYAVTVLSQPTYPSQTCVVANGNGTVGSADVSSPEISCTTKTFKVGGTVAGLVGAGLVLEDNGGDDLAVSANGAFTFATGVRSGQPFAITVKSQGPTQSCVVTGGSGIVGGDDVTSATVNCDTTARSVGGSISGLVGTGLSLALDSGDALSISSNGTFSFPTTLPVGASYAASVVQQPTLPSQTCVLANASGIVGAQGVTNINATCTINAYAVGGTVAGLLGSGLVLEDNGGDDISISSRGAFTFGASVASGQPYAVTVRTQPSNPTQTCAVTRGGGTIASADVSDVQVICTTAAYAVGGSVTGLEGTLVLQNDAGDNLTLSAPGAFSFATRVASGAPYSVTVLTEPASPSQTCTVAQGSGTVGASDVTGISISCVTNTYVVRGTVSGLQGSGLVLTNNGADNLAVTSNGPFAFATSLLSGAPYAVAVLTNPTGPPQTCNVSGGVGAVGGSDVSSVSVNCTTSYVVGGTVTGLAGTGLTLENDGGDDLSISGNGTFAFATPIASGGPFAVTVAAQPTTPWQTCSVGAGSGTVGSADVASVVVTCTTTSFPVSVNVVGLAGSGLVLTDNGGDYLAVAASGVSTFATRVASGASYAVSVAAQPSAPTQLCTVTAPTGVVAGASPSIDVLCATSAFSVGGSVKGLTGSGLVLTNNGGPGLSIVSGGGFTFPDPVLSGATYDVEVATQPSGQACTVTSGTGTVSSGNVANVAVSCAALFGPVQFYPAVGADYSTSNASGYIVMIRFNGPAVFTGHGSATLFDLTAGTSQSFPLHGMRNVFSANHAMLGTDTSPTHSPPHDYAMQVSSDLIKGYSGIGDNVTWYWKR